MHQCRRLLTFVCVDHIGHTVSVPKLSSFSDLSQYIPRDVMSHLTFDFPTPTSIQQFSLPTLLKENDAVVLAPTGSGKTLAFAVPCVMHVFQHTNKPQRRPFSSPASIPSAVVLSPTRELTQQTARVFEKLLVEDRRSRVGLGLVYGGTKKNVQCAAIRGANIIIATPGRLQDFVDDGEVDLTSTQIVVLDEADDLLKLGFERDVRRLLNYMSSRRQTIMFSATWNKKVRDIALEFLTSNYLMISAGAHITGTTSNTNITQSFVFCQGSEKIDCVLDMYSNGTLSARSKVILFARTRATTEFLCKCLEERMSTFPHTHRPHIGLLNGDCPQEERNHVMKLFRANTLDLLVCTDVAARGLDIADVSAIICYEFPENFEQYVHRIGRTGRAGKTGQSVTFLDWKNVSDVKMMDKLRNYLNTCGQIIPQELQL